MSKRITRSLALLIAFALTTIGVSFSQLSGIPKPQRAGVVAATTRRLAVVSATAEVLKETSNIRELAILRPVRSSAQSRAEIEQMLIKQLSRQKSAADMHAAELALRKFGLAPKGFAYRPFIIKLLTEQVAGYYDTRARQFHLADWLELDGQKPVMAHELTHALQDQHFNLRRFEKWPRGDSDAELAAHALIEGDATLAMTMYMAKNPLIALAFVRSIQSSGISSEHFSQAPRALRETLIFPYLRGMEWANEVYRRGGWSKVSKAFVRLPQSSEQILHPEKYFSYEAPVKVILPDLSNLLNKSRQQTANSKQQAVLVTRGRPTPSTRHPAPSVWRLIDYDVNGEWSYYLILDEFLKSPAESKQAAAGWAGDRYAVYERPKFGQVLLAHVSVWDTADDAREFFDAYVKRTALRYPTARLLTHTQHPAPDTVRRWWTNEGEVVIELRGSRVLVLEGIPEGVMSDVIVGLFSK
jgi:hypothetical protein